MTRERTIKVDLLTRVEGEGGLSIRLRGDRVEDLRLNIFEPPRFFEAFLRGRPLEDVPDITARICGICPVAYQMSSVHALEAALQVSISPEIRQLRRLFYCGEWIESHALHIYFLNAPDFLGYESGLAMAADHRQEVNRGLRLKKHGNQLLEVLGGRAIHPINTAVGGFYRAPRRDELTALIPDFEWGLQGAVDTVRWLAGFHYPQFERVCDQVALVHPDEYALNEGQITINGEHTFDVAQFEQEFIEEHVPHSTALHARRRSGEPYLVGPLARINLNRELLSPTARQLADEIGLECPCRNPFKSILARGLEVVHAYEEALDILRTYRPPNPPRIGYSYRGAEGCAATEAPRGLLYHRYRIGATGKIEFSTIIPPTSQNQKQIEHDLREYLPSVLTDDDQATALPLERLVRSYDPCISCSTHFLKISIERESLP